MKDIAVIICNYNKKDYVVKCINSVKDCINKNLDIYVVDNASSDDSVPTIEKEFGHLINLIINTQNLGGSGGFNTGIKSVIDKGYKYIYLLDNDVIIDSYALENLYNYMKSNLDIGVCGSKIYFMDKPDIIQEFGSFVDFDTFNMRLESRGRLDLETKEFIECDYVPACSALFRVEALKQIGTIDEDYFVYWDDIDLCHRLKLAGYKVMANSNSKVWHKGGGTVRKNTFGTYYFWRNRVYFFTKYCKDNEIQNFASKLFDEVFQAMYSCNYIGKYSSPRTIFMAISDALCNVRGISPDNRIFEVENIQDKLDYIIDNKKNILIINNVELNVLSDVIDRIKSKNETAHLNIILDKKQILKNEFEQCDIFSVDEIQDFTSYDLTIKTCNHILDVRDYVEDNIIYVDRFFNIISTNEDIRYIKNYDNTYNMLKNIWYPLLFNKILELKSILNEQH